MILPARLPRTLVIALAAAAVLLAGCTKMVDPAELEADILKDTATKSVPLAKVTCPADKPLKEGTKFECKCTDKKGTEGVFDVTIASSEGRVEWKLRNKFMNMGIVGDSLETNLTKKLGQPVDVVCPSENILIKKGVSFSCDVKVGDKKQKITLTAKADDGSDWDEKISG
jgi:hypothetical protein